MERRGSFESRLLVPRLVEAILQPGDLHAKIGHSRLSPLDLRLSGSDRVLLHQQGLFGLGSFAVQTPEVVRDCLVGPGKGVQFGLSLSRPGRDGAVGMFRPDAVFFTRLSIFPSAARSI